MTHDDLVARAAKWLRNYGHGLVFAECGATCSRQIPDAVGWTARGECTLIECKVSVEDFKRDKNKPSHRSGKLVGQRRYYMTPPGLVTTGMVPDGWGLLEAGRTVRRIVEAPIVESDRCEEVMMLVSEFRRLQGGFRPSLAIGVQHIDPLPGNNQQDAGFAGEHVDCVFSLDDAGHELSVHDYRFADGTVRPYLRISEAHNNSGAAKVLPIPEVVHALQNLTEQEFFALGNREAAQ